MSYKTNVVFGRRESVFIVSPDFLSMPKLDIDLPANVKINSGEFVGYDGNKLTLAKTKEPWFLVTEASYYNDMLSRSKPSGVVEGYFGEMVMNTKVFEEGGTAFAPGDKVTIIDGKLAHPDDDHTIEVGEVVRRGTDWLTVIMG